MHPYAVKTFYLCEKRNTFYGVTCKHEVVCDEATTRGVVLRAAACMTLTNQNTTAVGVPERHVYKQIEC